MRPAFLSLALVLLCTPLARAALADEATAPAPAPIAVGEHVFTDEEIAEGAAIFERRCSACHGLDGRNYKGPYLNGVVDRPSASIEGWVYSAALKGWGGIWTVENLQEYLTKPSAFIPDVEMNFGGFRSRTEDRDKVIAYLIQQGLNDAGAASE